MPDTSQYDPQMTALQQKAERSMTEIVKSIGRSLKTDGRYSRAQLKRYYDLCSVYALPAETRMKVETINSPLGYLVLLPGIGEISVAALATIAGAASATKHRMQCMAALPAQLERIEEALELDPSLRERMLRDLRTIEREAKKLETGGADKRSKFLDDLG